MISTKHTHSNGEMDVVSGLRVNRSDPDISLLLFFFVLLIPGTSWFCCYSCHGSDLNR